jgi:hypothetical protein
MMFIISLFFVFISFFVAGNIAYLLLNESEPAEVDRSRKKQKIFLVALWFPLMAAWFVLTYSAYNNSQNELNEVELKFKLQELKTLETANNNAMNAADSLNKSFFEANNFIKVESLMCENGIFQGDRQEYLITQYQHMLELEQLSFSLRPYFEEGVYEKVRDYLTQSEKDLPICENSTISEELLALQSEINLLIDEKINENAERIAALRKDID